MHIWKREERFGKVHLILESDVNLLELLSKREILKKVELNGMELTTVLFEGVNGCHLSKYCIDFEVAEFYRNYMKKKYNVDMGNKGCVVSKEITCYSRKMKELILEKFGADFFDRTKKEARELFDKTD